MPTIVKLLSVSQVAGRLGVSRTYVQRLIGRGCFPGAIRLGEFVNSAYAVPEKDLNTFIKTRRPMRQKSKGE